MFKIKTHISVQSMGQIRMMEMRNEWYSSIVQNSQDMKATLVSINRWRDKMWYIYIMEHYSAIKESGIVPFAATWMDLLCLVK